MEKVKPGLAARLLYMILRVLFPATKATMPPLKLRHRRGARPIKSNVPNKRAVPAHAVVLDPGHGGKDRGAVNVKAGVSEKDVSLLFAMRVDTALQGLGWKTTLTRKDDTFVSLQDRTAMANKLDGPLVSIHCNAAKNTKARGAETWCYAMKNSTGQRSAGARLADAIQKELVRAGLKNRKVKAIYSRAKKKYIYRRLWMLRKSKNPAVIVECGFISNDIEARQLVTEPLTRAIPRAIARGIREYMKAA